MSKYCNKDIKVISVPAIFVTLCQLWKWFCMLRKLWKPPSRKSYENLRNLQGKYLWQSFDIVKPFFLRFTVTLFYSNSDEKGNEQRAKSNEQWAASKKFSLKKIGQKNWKNYIMVKPRKHEYLDCWKRLKYRNLNKCTY